MPLLRPTRAWLPLDGFADLLTSLPSSLWISQISTVEAAQ